MYRSGSFGWNLQAREFATFSQQSGHSSSLKKFITESKLSSNIMDSPTSWRSRKKEMIITNNSSASWVEIIFASLQINMSGQYWKIIKVIKVWTIKKKASSEIELCSGLYDMRSNELRYNIWVMFQEWELNINKTKIYSRKSSSWSTSICIPYLAAETNTPYPTSNVLRWSSCNRIWERLESDVNSWQ